MWAAALAVPSFEQPHAASVRAARAAHASAMEMRLPLASASFASRVKQMCPPPPPPLLLPPVGAATSSHAGLVVCATICAVSGTVKDHGVLRFQRVESSVSAACSEPSAQPCTLEYASLTTWMSAAASGAIDVSLFVRSVHPCQPPPWPAVAMFHVASTANSGAT